MLKGISSIYKKNFTETFKHKNQYPIQYPCPTGAQISLETNIIFLKNTLNILGSIFYIQSHFFMLLLPLHSLTYKLFIS